jgi:hypothetical protein
MDQGNLRALSLVVAGSLVGYVALFIPPALVTLPFIGVIVVLTVFLLSYGTGIPQGYYHRTVMSRRRQQPFKIAILNDMGWDLSDSQTYTWADVSPTDWKSALETSAAADGLRIQVRLANTRVNLESYACVLNPYGGVYPESDLRHFKTLGKILEFVRKGGLFVNVADIPGYWAYSPTLKRRVDATPSVYAGYQVGGSFTLLSQKPFDLVPLMKELALRSLNLDPPLPVNLNGLVGTPATVNYRRTVVVESNVETAVQTASLRYPDGTMQNTSPLFFARYGEGDFLISLIWINDTTHNEAMKNSLKTAISRLAVERVKTRFMVEDQGPNENPIGQRRVGKEGETSTTGKSQNFQHKQKLDDSVKLLLVVMSILYTTAFALRLKTDVSPPNQFFIFPMVSVVPFAVGNLLEGDIEMLLKSFSIYFLTFSLGFFSLVILSIPSAPLISVLTYSILAVCLMLSSLFFSVTSVIYVNGNLLPFKSRGGFILLASEVIVTLLVASVMIAVVGILS